MQRLTILAKRFNFPENSRFLQEAFTHRSYAVEHNLDYDNQRLEFLGDSVLEIVLTEDLFRRYPEMSEGDMTKARSALACESTLAKLARELMLGPLLRIGKGELGSGGPERESTLADLFEAFVGAMFLELGFDAVRTFLLEVFSRNIPEPKQLLIELNPKGKLQEFSQQKWNEIPRYIIFKQSGPQHLPCYEVEVHLHCYTAVGKGRSRKNAEFAAASALYHFLQQKGTIPHDF